MEMGRLWRGKEMKHLKKQAMQGLATVSASVLVLSMGVETLANSRAQFINGRLGTTNYQVIQTDSESDGIYYKFFRLQSMMG